MTRKVNPECRQQHLGRHEQNHRDGQADPRYESASQHRQSADELNENRRPTDSGAGTPTVCSMATKCSGPFKILA